MPYNLTNIWNLKIKTAVSSFYKTNKAYRTEVKQTKQSL